MIALAKDFNAKKLGFINFLCSNPVKQLLALVTALMIPYQEIFTSQAKDLLMTLF